MSRDGRNAPYAAKNACAMSTRVHLKRKLATAMRFAFVRVAMTLMSEGASRRCDSRCYNAKRNHCECLCGGLNHSAGLKQSMDNIRNMFLPMIEKGPARDLRLGKQVARKIAEERQQMVLPLENLA